MDDSRLSTRMLNTTVAGYGAQNKRWVQFVSDHKRYIRQNSDIQEFTTFDLVRYKYRPEEFFKDKAGCTADCTWIYLMVNDMRSPEDLNMTVTRLWMPRFDLIQQLRRSFEQSAQISA